jgi:hypothetical protein
MSTIGLDTVSTRTDPAVPRLSSSSIGMGNERGVNEEGKGVVITGVGPTTKEVGATS